LQTIVERSDKKTATRRPPFQLLQKSWQSDPPPTPGEAQTGQANAE
jgi:hypothetical protein